MRVLLQLAVLPSSVSRPGVLYSPLLADGHGSTYLVDIPAKPHCLLLRVPYVDSYSSGYLSLSCRKTEVLNKLI